MTKLYNADCLEILPDIESGSVDSIVTDPPAGISFMNKSWDKDHGGRDNWIEWITPIFTECLRVLKPGGHGLVWALPRTSHWTMTALENAGFEIRDIVHHLFGSGFPKSHDVSKGIDKRAGVEREVVGPMVDSDGRIRSTENWSKEQKPGFNDSLVSNNNITKPTTPEAKQYDGWGSALKPAVENWILVRKPLAGSIAENVLEHGTGGINIDGCRVGTKSVSVPQWKKLQYREDDEKGRNGKMSDNTKGRFPSNLLLTHSENCTDVCEPDCPIGLIDLESGYSSEKARVVNVKPHNKIFSNPKPRESNMQPGSGGASRYFKQFTYQPKASPGDRETNNTHPTVKATSLMAYLCRLITPIEGTILDPFMGSGSTGVAATKSGFSFIGIEKETEYYNIAKKRLNPDQLELFG